MLRIDFRIEWYNILPVVFRISSVTNFFHLHFSMMFFISFKCDWPNKKTHFLAHAKEKSEIGWKFADLQPFLKSVSRLLAHTFRRYGGFQWYSIAKRHSGWHVHTVSFIFLLLESSRSVHVIRDRWTKHAQLLPHSHPPARQI